MSANDQEAGVFRLTEGQLNTLETFHRRLLRFLLYQLDDEFLLKPHEQADSAALGSLLIQVLKSSDSRAFKMINQGVLHALLKSVTHHHPHAALAMASSGMTRNKLFEEVLTLMRDEAERDGRIPFGGKVLGEEGPESTLFCLNLLKRAGREGDHTSIIEPAMAYLEKNADSLLEESPAMAAKLLKAGLDHGTELAKRSMENLVERQHEDGRWDDSPTGLAADAEVACALIEAAPVLGDTAAAERWLTQAFLLEHEGELPEFPPIVDHGRSANRPDLWIEAVLKTALAASLCLARERPDHNPGAYLLALSVPQENILVRAEEIIKLASPYLPPLDEVKERGPQLLAFWDAGGSFDKSVFIMCGSSPTEEQETLLKAITETLLKHELMARYLGEGTVPFQSDPWDNAALYMTGCRYGIALLEGKIDVAPAELLYQTGFMRGQGSPVLVLWDNSVQGEDAVAFPGVRSPMTGILASGYDPNEQDLADLQKGLSNWVSALAEKKD